MNKLDAVFERGFREAQASPAGVSERSRSTVACLSRRRWLTIAEKRKHPKLAHLEWIEGSLTFSGFGACGDELNAPVSVAIDIGQEFVITPQGTIFVSGKGEFYPPTLLNAARQGWFGFTLLYDEQEEIDDQSTDRPQE